MKSQRGPHRSPPEPGSADVRDAPWPATVGAAVATFLISLGVYLRTLHPGLPGPDSGELITVAHTLGVAHPPGYPLYTLVGHVFDRVLPWGTPAWRMNLFSAVLDAGAAAVIAIAISLLTRRAWAGLAAGCALAFARSYWKSALVAEVFPLNNLMASLLWLGFIMVLKDAGLVGRRTARSSPSPWPLALMAGVTAAIPAHHHSLLILAVPLDIVALGLVVIPARRAARWLPGYGRPYALAPRHLGIAIALSVAALAPLAYLPVAAARDPVMNWGDPATVPRFLAHLLRSEYGTFSLAAMGGASVPGTDHALRYMKAIPVEFTWWGAVLAAAGMVVLAIVAWRGRLGTRTWSAARPLLAVVLGTALLQALFFSRVPFSAEVPFYRGIVDRFFPLPHVTLAVLVGLGAAFLASLLPRRGQAAAALVIATGSVLAPILAHGRDVDQAGNRFNEDLARNVLASTPQNAVLFLVGDLFSHDLHYLTLVGRERPDVALVDQALLMRPWYVQSLRRRHPDLLPPFAAIPAADRYTGDGTTGSGRWIDHLRGRRPAAFLGLLDSSFAGRYEMVEHGLVQLASPIDRPASPEARARASLEVLSRLRLESFFREQDPTSAEAFVRWRVPRMIARLCMLLCEPETHGLSRERTPGLGELADFLDRYATTESAPDPELLRASGFVHAFHPEFRNPERAHDDLTRYMATGPTGEKADGARRLLAALRQVTP